ncbi:MAG: methylenetetrahydrofolate reductase, partial [Thermodesulfobacteriota bacterium]|nr:methylenetetrahydrofolate reductase [Thermodesulfobacteriota bacterium]
MVSSFKKALESGRFVVTSEVAPPKGTNLEKMIHHIELLKDRVDAMNVTDHQSSVMRFPSLGGALLVKEMGGEPILQMTCRDRNRMIRFPRLTLDVKAIYAKNIFNLLSLKAETPDFSLHGSALYN